MNQPWIEIPTYQSFDLFLQHEEISNEWTLNLIARYNYVNLTYTDVSGKLTKQNAEGFYLLKTETAAITLERLDSNWRVELKADVNKIWHVGQNSSIKLQTKITPFALSEINKKIGSQDLKISWQISGYGFLADNDAKKINALFARIDASSQSSKVFSKGQFYEQIFNKVDGYKREFLEINIPSIDSINKAPSELQPLAKLLTERSIYLQDALKKYHSATNSREYADAIGDVRTALDAMEKQLRNIKDDMSKLLIQDMGIITGDGSEKQSKAIISQILDIINRLEGLSSGLGIHTVTSEKTKPESYIPNPDNLDTKYIILMSILTLDYLSGRLSHLITKRNF
jgi:hypothetical protein